MATSTLSIAPHNYQVGTSTASRTVPGGNYTGFHITADYSPWTSPATTLVRITLSVSYDNGATWQEVTHADEITPPPWVGRWGTSSSVTIDASYPGGVQPTNAQGAVTVEGAAVNLGTITVSLE